MSTGKVEVLGLGNSLVDILSLTDDAYLNAQDMLKGAMTLIDAREAETLYARMGPAIECSGGSAANTIAGIASLGGSTAFIGKVRDDQLGRVFRHDIRALGVHFETPAATSGPATARCLVFITPDAQRTLETYLGAAVELGREDVDPALIGAAKVTYLEGYLWDPPRA